MKKATRALTSVDRAKAIRTFYKFGRKYPQIWKNVQTNVSFHDFFDSANIYMDRLDFSDVDKVKEWIEFSLSDFNAARKLYKSENGIALYHLQQGVEKLLKACLIFTGFKTENNVISLNHKPQKFAIELLNDPSFQKVAYENFPLKKVKKLKKPTDEKIAELTTLITTKDKVKALDDGDNIIEGVSLLLGSPQPILHDPNGIGEITKRVMEKNITHGELKKFIRECNEESIGYDKMIYNGSNYCYIVMNMAVVLLPLAIGLTPFESVTRYPDESRKLTKKFEEYHAYTGFDTILSQVDKFAEFFKKFVENE